MEELKPRLETAFDEMPNRVLSPSEESYLQSLFARAAEWMAEPATERETLDLGFISPDYRILLLRRLRERYHTTLSMGLSGGRCTLYKLSFLGSSEDLGSLHQQRLEAQFREAIGFGHVVSCLMQEHKKLCCFAGLVDLMRLWEYFIAPLPPTLSKWCEQLNSYFPVIFDFYSCCQHPTLQHIRTAGCPLSRQLFSVAHNHDAPIVVQDSVVGTYPDNGDELQEAGFVAYRIAFVGVRMVNKLGAGFQPTFMLREHFNALYAPDLPTPLILGSRKARRSAARSLERIFRDFPGPCGAEKATEEETHG
jgi:hypothetical protein